MILLFYNLREKKISRDFYLKTGQKSPNCFYHSVLLSLIKRYKILHDAPHTYKQDG